MDIINFFVNLLSDPRGAIAGWIIALGPLWVYSPLFLIVFVETGLVFFPFLPGDSLLFAAGVFSADGGGLNVWATLIVFYVAAILGNTSNYWIARFFGARIIDSGKVKALTPERMSKLDHFFAKYGGLTIVITRFMPFFRTFAPFIAGTGHMNFGKFTLFNCIGGIAWVSLFVLVGYFFGGIPLVQDHFEVIVLGIVAVSVAPAIIGAVKAAMSSRKNKTADGRTQAQAGIDAELVEELELRGARLAARHIQRKILRFQCLILRGQVGKDLVELCAAQICVCHQTISIKLKFALSKETAMQLCVKTFIIVIQMQKKCKTYLKILHFSCFALLKRQESAFSVKSAGNP